MKTDWQTKKLGEVIKLEYGKPLPKSKRKNNGKYPVYGANGVKTRSDAFYFDKPSIIVGRKGSAGELKLVDGKFWPLDVTYFVTFDEKKYDLKFLYNLLETLELTKLARGVKPGINRNEVYRVDVDFPTLIEQKRIVKILDDTFDKVVKVKESAEKNLKNSKELFEAYLQGVFANPGKGWEEKKIGDLCSLMTGGTPNRSKKEYFENGAIRWLVSGDVNMKEILDCDGRVTELGMKNSNAKYLPINSVMIALNGQGKTRGMVAMLRSKATCNQSLVSIYPKDAKKMLPEYVYHNLNVRYDEIRKITGDTGNDRRGLNMPLIRNIKIQYPKSIQEQKNLINKFEKLSKETKRLEKIYEQKLADLEELKKSVLQKAFSGAL